MGGAHHGPRQLFRQAGGAALDGIHPVVEVEDLSPPAQLLAHRLGDDGLAVLQHVGLHRVAVLGGLLDDAHVPDAAHGHVQGPGDGGGGKGEHIHAGAQLLEPLLVGHPEPLLLVDDAKAQVPEFYILLHQLVGAHHHIDAPLRQLFQNFPLLLGGAEPA